MGLSWFSNRGLCHGDHIYRNHPKSEEYFIETQRGTAMARDSVGGWAAVCAQRPERPNVPEPHAEGRLTRPIVRICISP